MTAQTKRGLRWMLVPVVTKKLTVAPVFAEDELPPEPAATEEPVILGEPARHPLRKRRKRQQNCHLRKRLKGPAQEEPVVVPPAEEIPPEPVAEGELLAEELDMASVPRKRWQRPTCISSRAALPTDFCQWGGAPRRVTGGRLMVPNTKCLKAARPSARR